MSWGSWGWDVLSSTVAAVNETATDLLNDLAEAIDVPEGEMPIESKELAEALDGEVVDGEAATTPKAPAEPIVYRSHVLDALSTGASFIGSAVSKSVSIIQNTDISAISLDASVAEAISGLTDTLAGAVVVDSPVRERKSDATSNSANNNNNNNESGEDNKKGADDEISLSSLESWQKAQSSLSSLENFSIKCMMDTQRVYRLLPFEDRESVDDASSAIDETFEEHGATEELEEGPNDAENVGFSIKLPFADLESEFDLQALKAFSSEHLESLKTLNSTLSEKIGSTPPEAQNILAFVKQEIRSTEETGLAALGTYLSIAVEHVLQLSRKLVSEEYCKDKDVDQLAHYFCSLLLSLQQALKALSASHISLLQERKAILLNSLAPQQTTEEEKPTADSQIQQQIDEIANAAANRMTSGLGNALGHVIDTKKYCVSVCKALDLLQKFPSSTVAGSGHSNNNNNNNAV